MITIDNWSFVQSEIIYEADKGKYISKISHMTTNFNSKLVRLCGVIRDNGNEEYFISEGIDKFYEGYVETLTGRKLKLGEENQYYVAYKAAVEEGIPIIQNIYLIRGLVNEYQIFGIEKNGSRVFKKIISQDVEKNILGFSDESRAFIDWTNGVMDDKVKFDIITKKIQYVQFCGLNIVPIFKPKS